MVVAGRLSNWIRGICQSELLFLFEGNIGGNWKYEISFTLGLNKRVRGISTPPTYDAVLATDYRQRDHPCYCLWSHGFWFLLMAGSLKEELNFVRKTKTNRKVVDRSPPRSSCLFPSAQCEWGISRSLYTLLLELRGASAATWASLQQTTRSSAFFRKGSHWREGALGVVSLELCCLLPRKNG